ncbi:hypothetical protein [Shewanella algae]|uniref:hypothetical protein n=1 Tax=Shewanella algae TaxID=38313 RepID=UPI001AAE0F16|nr:hypothetical protein [Shewanella algae]QTE81332.1 hypothetical protein JKK46_16945 [Shewanella algae]
MVDFSISQIGALILLRNFKISNLLESKIIGAPLKADVWHLRCKKDERLKLQKELAGKLKQNEQNSSLGLVLEEIDEICKNNRLIIIAHSGLKLVTIGCCRYYA